MQKGPESSPANDWVTIHIDDLHGHLCARLQKREDAQDIAQEACLKLLQAGRKGNDIRNPKAYLFQIAHHLISQHYTTRKRRPTFSDVEIELIQSADEGIETLTLNTIRRQQINKAFSELSAKCQRALILRWREGLRVSEIATEMSLSHAMVKKYLATGLAHFRRRLGRFVLADQAAG